MILVFPSLRIHLDFSLARSSILFTLYVIFLLFFLLLFFVGFIFVDFDSFERSMQPKIKYNHNNDLNNGKKKPPNQTDKSNKKNFIDDNDVSIYKTKRTISTSLFTASTRPQHIQQMYEQAAPTPVLPILCNVDTNSEDSFSVCPLSFGHTRRQIKKKIDAEIETRVVSIETFYLFSCHGMPCREIVCE